jgi:hypothetical protein
LPGIFMRSATQLRRYAGYSRFPKRRCIGLSRLGIETSKPRTGQGHLLRSRHRGRTALSSLLPQFSPQSDWHPYWQTQKIAEFPQQPAALVILPGQLCSTITVGLYNPRMAVCWAGMMKVTRIIHLCTSPSFFSVAPCLYNPSPVA